MFLLYPLVIGGDEGWNPLPVLIDTANQEYVMEAVYDKLNNYLYVMGTFTSIAGNSMNRIARWDGEKWHPLGGGLKRISRNRHMELDGEGNLYVLGSFYDQESPSSPVLGKWDGESWEFLGENVSLMDVHQVHVHEDGNVIIGGEFSINIRVDEHRFTHFRNLAVWNGVNWNQIGGGDFNYVVKSFYFESPDSIYVIGHNRNTIGTRRIIRMNISPQQGSPTSVLSHWDGQKWNKLRESGSYTFLKIWDNDGEKVFLAQQMTSSRYNNNFFVFHEEEFLPLNLGLAENFSMMEITEEGIIGVERYRGDRQSGHFEKVVFIDRETVLKAVNEAIEANRISHSP